VFATDLRAENSFEKILLEPPDNRVFIEQVQKRRMTLENLRAAFFFVRHDLRHVTFAIPFTREPLRALQHGGALDPAFQIGALALKNTIKQFLRRIRSIILLDGFQKLVRNLISIGRKKIVRAFR
jgi:hypothetical protein